MVKNLTALLRIDGYLFRCLSRALYSPDRSNAAHQVIEAKRSRFFRNGFHPSAREHVCSDLCSPKFSLPYLIVRPRITYPLPVALANILVSFSFIWPAVTMNLNHSLLRLRKADVKHYLLTRNSALERAASPFGLYRASTGPDFAEDVLDEFDDIKTKVDDELRMQAFEMQPWRQREIVTIYLDGTGM